MEMRKADLQLIRAGFMLFTLALLTGLAVPVFANPRMAVAAHLNAILGAIVLIVVGLVWGLLVMSPAQARLTRATFVFSGYAAWGTACLAAAWGTSRLTPIAGEGHTALPWQETVVAALQSVIVVTVLAGALSVVYALRPRAVAERTESVF